jgi:hypothetical protein
MKKPSEKQWPLVFEPNTKWLPACTPLDFPKELAKVSRERGSVAGAMFADILAECNYRSCNLQGKVVPKRVHFIGGHVVRFSNGLIVAGDTFCVGYNCLRIPDKPEKTGRDSRGKFLGPGVTEYNQFISNVMQALEGIRAERKVRVEE